MSAVQRSTQRLQTERRWPATAIDSELLFDTTRNLTARGEATTGLFAVALVREGRSLGWPEPWRDLLRSLREHPIADVRDAAFDISMEAV